MLGENIIMHVPARKNIGQRMTHRFTDTKNSHRTSFRACGFHSLKRPDPFLDFERLEEIASLDVVGRVERHAAFEA